MQKQLQFILISKSGNSDSCFLRSCITLQADSDLNLKFSIAKLFWPIHLHFYSQFLGAF